MTATTPETGLERHGIDAVRRVIHNPTTAQLYSHASRGGAGRLAEGGPLVVDTGRFTGQLAAGQVRRPTSRAPRTGSGGARSTTPSARPNFDGLRAKVVAHLADQDVLYVVDAFAGADPEHRDRRPSRHREPVPRALREDDVHRPDGPTSSTVTSWRRSCSTRPRSRRIPRTTARAPARSSCCTRPGARC